MHGRFLIGVAALTTLLALGSGHPLLARLAWTLWGFIGVAALLTWSALRGVVIERQTRTARTEGCARHSATMPSSSVSCRLKWRDPANSVIPWRMKS